MGALSPDDFEKSIIGIATLVLAPTSFPGKIIASDKTNESEDWKEADDKENSNATIGSYLDDVEAGLNSLTKGQTKTAP
jgi:hypothetical protein